MNRNSNNSQLDLNLQFQTTSNGKWVSNNFKVTSKLFLWNFQLSFFEFWRSHFIFPHELIELLKVSKFEIFQNGIHIIFKPLFISLNGTSHIIFTLGFCDEMNLNSWRSKDKMKVLGKSFYSLSFNFQKVSNITHFQSINHTTIKQSIKSIYLL